jgi:hypothetical protein
MDIQVLLIGALVGVLSTLIMDLDSLVGYRKGYAGSPPRTGFHLIGRWFGHLLRGKLTHKTILDTPPLPHEVQLGLVVHYVIGAFLGALYFAVLLAFSITPTLITALAFGVATTVFTWFFLHPCWGYGWLGAHAKGMRLTYFSLFNHITFGLGLALWTYFLYPK